MDKMRDVVGKLMGDIGVGAIVVTSVGTISREVCQVCDRPTNFYLMGSMGCALGVGIGIALNTSKQVYVIAGDGEILMSLGTLSVMRYLHLPNLALRIIDNHSYAATGGQPTCSSSVDFSKMAGCLVYHVVPEKTEAPRIPLTPEQITERFRHAIGSV